MPGLAKMTQVTGMVYFLQWTLSSHYVDSLIVTVDTNTRYGMANDLSTRT